MIRSCLRLLALCLLALLPVAHAAPMHKGSVQLLPERFEIDGLQRSREVRIYLPPGYASQADRRYPVLYLYDGQNLFDAATAFAGEWEVDETLDRLAREQGFEAIAVGIDHGGEHRITELSAWDHPRHGRGEGEAFTRFLVGTLKPYVDRHYRTEAGPARTVLVGSSMGALAAHYAIHRHPEVFGGAILFSPSYWYAEAAFVQAVQQPLPATARVFLYAGGREGEEMTAAAQRMHALLLGLPTPPATQLHIVAEAEHNESAWRQELPHALGWLFGLSAAAPTSAPAAAGRAPDE